MKAILFLSLFLTIGITAMAQVQNNGNLRMHGSNMAVYGNFKNEGTFNNNGGTLWAHGASGQTFNGANTIVADNFTVKNSASGSALVLGKDIEIEGTLTLTDGIVETGSNKVYIKNNAAGAVTGHSDASFINGNLKRNITANTGTYALPVGKSSTSTDYHPTEFVNNNLTGTSNITASVAAITESGNNTNENLSISEGGTPLVNLLNDAVWTITPNAAPTGGNYGVKLYVTNVNGLSASDDNKFTVVKREESSTTYADFSSFDSTTTLPDHGTAGMIYNSGNGYAQKTGFTSFSHFAIAKADNVLPVELIRFIAKALTERTAITQWETASETNCDYFTVERSIDIVEWSTVGDLPGAGNSQVINRYEMIDETPFFPTTYYRLKQVDFDGECRYSNVKAVVFDQYGSVFATLFPNPAKTAVTLMVNAEHYKNAEMEIVDALGKVITKESIQLKKGQNQFTRSTTALSDGIYFLRLKYPDGKTNTIMFVIQQ